MNRNDAVETIKATYPPDSEHPETAEIGQRLLEETKRELTSWECESTAVLIRLAQKCIKLENGEGV